MEPKHILCFVSQTSVGESLQREAVKKKMMKQVRAILKKFLCAQTQSLLCDLHFSGLCLFVILLCLKTRLEMQKALEQDSTVYDYDAVYDDIQNQRLESNKKILHGADKRVIVLMVNTYKAVCVNTCISGWWNGLKDCPWGICAVVLLFCLY